jgi:hypothetical protein
LYGLSFDSIGEIEANWLEGVFNVDEVFELVKALNSDKFLGPDGYSMAFFQVCWKVLTEDIMNVFHDFHARGKFERCLNATFIGFISKKSRVLILGTFDL